VLAQVNAVVLKIGKNVDKACNLFFKKAAPADGVAVFVQSELNGSIIAASVLMPSARTATRLSMNAIVKPL